MYTLNDLLESFVAQSREILGDNLVGIYLHGSAVMGCWNEKKSDIDLLVVVNETVPDGTKRRFMDMVVELNRYAPPKGIEMSVVKREVCSRFVYPTPYELHFSIAHLERYRAGPSDYIDKMRGTDRDLAAHFTVIIHRGKCLYGDDIRNVFGEVGKEYYFDSIRNDIAEAETEITDNPVYIILNLCRVLAYKRDELILSKREGGSWGMRSLPEKYRALIARALDEYSSDRPASSAEWDKDSAREFAAYMLEQIGC